MSNLLFKEIDNTVEIDEFCCGNEIIDNFLKNLAISNNERKLSKTYVLCREEDKKVIAFFSLSASRLNTGDARIFGMDKVPVALLGQLGVDKNYNGRNLGKNLIKIALEKAYRVGKMIACRLLLIETTPDNINYYLKKVHMGFEHFGIRRNYNILYIDLLKYERNRN